MPLLNYTTTVPAVRTISQVQVLLVEAGARQIMSEYDETGRATGIAFTVETMHGLRQFHLPVNSARVHNVLDRDRKVERRYKTPDQAERVAWRIVKDWLEAQLAIIRTEMVTLDQVMLAYMQGDNGQTVWELYVNQQLAIGSGSDP